MKNIHSDTLAKANRLANRAASSYPQASTVAIIAIRDAFLEKLQERIEKRGNTIQSLNG